MRNTILLLFFPLIFFYSCTSDSIDNPSEDNFYALKVGNSWVYKAYIIRSDDPNFLESTSLIDSVTITGTKEIDNNIYYKFRRRTSGVESLEAVNFLSINQNGETVEYLRDSLGYLVNDKGLIKYTNSDYEEIEIITFQNINVGLFAKLQENLSSISTQAGIFESLDMNTYVRNLNTNEQYPSINHDYYSDGIGRISYSNSFVISPYPKLVYNLDSYELE